MYTKLAFLTVLCLPAAGSDFYATFPLPANVQATALDAANTLYLAGTTNTANLMTTPGAYQTGFDRTSCGVIYMGHVPVPVYCEHAFFARVDPTGTRVLTLTYITGTGSDTIAGLAIAPDGSVWIAGSTRPPDAAESSGFLVHVSANGTQLISSLTPSVVPTALAVDSEGRVYVAGSDGDAVVLVYNGAGALLWKQTFGGASVDMPAAIAVDTQGSVVVAGYTESTGTNPAFPTTPNSYHTSGGSTDVFVTKLSADGSSIVYSSVFGGEGVDTAQAVALDSAGNAFVAGNTLDPSTFPTTENALRRTGGGPFAAKLSADGTGLLFGTFIGSQPGDYIDRIALDTQNRLMLAGWTTDFTFPTTLSALDPCYPDADPARFFTVLGAAGDRADYSTFVHQRVLAVSPTGQLDLQGTENIIDIVDPYTPVAAGPRCLVSAASFRDHTVAPGELISVFGSSLGPDQGVAGLATTLAGTRLLFGGIPAPLLYVSSGQINAVVPFAMEPGTTMTATVERDGLINQDSPITVPVVAAVPSIFAVGEQAAVINQDGTVNGENHPAGVGSVVSLWATGFGAMLPPRQDGDVPQDAGSVVAAQVQIFVVGQRAEVLYAGDAPGLVAGVVQINFRIPSLPETGFVRVFAYAGDAYTDYRVTTSIWVR